ncbi:nitrite reductase small subunit NirD [Cohnella sp. GCM10027633]|uniref:nitrite reductase small subunit NirD n=1 Tax=unclassified Cohnella TaxID=2636738 RepID=UPI0036373311
MADILIGHMSDFTDRRARTVQWNGTEWAVFLLSDGTFRAIENSCPHKAGKLSEGIVCDHHVYCPLHDWKIDMNDGQVQAPDTGCVEKLEVRYDAATGKVYLQGEAGSLRKTS